MKDNRLRITVPEDFREMVKRTAKENGESISNYVREAIEQRVERNNQPKFDIEPRSGEMPVKTIIRPLVRDALEDLEEYVIKLRMQHSSEMDGILNRVKKLRG